jgi:hypothetical protein
MFCTPKLVFGSTEGVGSRFHVLRFWTRFGQNRAESNFQVSRSRTLFRRYRWHRVPFSCFALSNWFSTVHRVSGPVFMFCASELIVGDTDGVGSSFHVLRSRSRFGRYRGRGVLFSCFALLDPFLAVPRASGLVFMLCAPGPILSVIESVRFNFHVLRSRTGPILGGTKRWGSYFHVFRFRTRFGRYQGRRVSFSYYALLDLFWVVPRAPSPVLIFCAPVGVFSRNESVRSNFHVLRSRIHFRRYRARLDLKGCSG